MHAKIIIHERKVAFRLKRRCSCGSRAVALRATHPRTACKKGVQQRLRSGCTLGCERLSRAGGSGRGCCGGGLVPRSHDGQVAAQAVLADVRVQPFDVVSRERTSGQRVLKQTRGREVLRQRAAVKVRSACVVQRQLKRCLGGGKDTSAHHAKGCSRAGAHGGTRARIKAPA